MKKLSYFNVTICALAVMLGAACSKKNTKHDDVLNTSASAVSNEMGDSDSDSAMGLKTIHYGYDTATLDVPAKTSLIDNADVLKKNSAIEIQIEGHCDIRGGTQYNLALGEKRAQAARKFLLDQGVPAKQISTISYGKEHLLDSANNEGAHSKNRRANFRVTAAPKPMALN